MEVYVFGNVDQNRWTFSTYLPQKLIIIKNKYLTIFIGVLPIIYFDNVVTHWVDSWSIIHSTTS